MNNLANAYRTAGRPTEALPLFEEALRLSNAKLGPDHPDTLLCLAGTARLLHEMRRSSDAQFLFEGLMASLEKRNYDHPFAGPFVRDALKCWEDTGQWPEAELRRRRWVVFVKSRAGAASPTYAAELAGLGSNLMRQKRFVEAETILRECLAIRQERASDNWITFNTESLLGEALVGQKKFAGAEPRLLKGYEGMKQREATIPKAADTAIPQALDRLIQLYTETNRPDDVKKWQAERAKYPEANGGTGQK
jgi:tetratricopeptide (TPR) repeat protein